MRSPYHRYGVELAITMTVYGIVVFVSASLLNLSLPSLLRIPIALMPMIPAGFFLIVVVRLLRRVDEFHRKFHLEALGFGFTGTAVLTFTYGWLQLAGFPQVSWLFVWPLMAIMWGIGLAWSAWRYR
ncbi:MAG: hypothetical protein V7K89_29930 [Nostoc sp.]|uniref:hypothetical protein n=1 Tax=Nostoc sp. TaxID=1180 RepID=UPI002FF5D1C4